MYFISKLQRADFYHNKSLPLSAVYLKLVFFGLEGQRSGLKLEQKSLWLNFVH